VTVWYAEGEAFSGPFVELVDQFAAAHPEVEVHLDDLGSQGRGGVLDWWRATAPENRPSLALMPEDATRLIADSGQAVAPGRCLADAIPDLVPAIEAAWSVDGVAQAVPFAVSTPVLIYNRRAFRDAGLDPGRPPSSLGDLRTAAEEIVSQGIAETGLLFDTGGQGGAGWFVEQWNAQAGALSLAPDNGRADAADDVVWQDSPAVEHLVWLRDMVDDSLAASVGSGGGIEDLAGLVGEHPRAAMTLHTSAALPALIDVVVSGQLPGFELGVAPLPGPGRGSLPGGVGLWLAADRPEAETRAAWSLAAFLGSPTAQAQWAAATGYAPVTTRAAEMEPLRSTWVRRPQQAVGYQALLETATAPASMGMSVGPERELKVLLAEAVRAVLAGDTPSTALGDAAADAEQLLGAYNRSR
jgi:sn-glycerol 3-phosphate transport system substrate-binding protein